MTKENKAAAAAFSLKDGLEPVSELTTNRLSVYLRCLNALDAAGVKTISSQALAEQFHLNAAQIRKDLANFGEFGVRGVGYYVKELRRTCARSSASIARIRVAIMGAGNLGLALADYPGFRDEGFEIVALFDTQRDKIGQRSRAGVPILDVRTFRRTVRRERIAIAVIAVPAPSAPRGAQRSGRRRDQGRAQFLAGHHQSAARRQGEEHGSDRVARKPVVLPRPGQADE